MKISKDFTRSRGFKILLLALLILLFLIPVSMIQEIIFERSLRAAEVEREIMNSWSGEFVVQGPVLRLPVLETEEIKTKNDKGEEKTELRTHRYFLWMTPEELRVKVELGSEIKKRGIFSVPLFSGRVNLSGYFDPALVMGELKPGQTVYPEQAELIIALASQRSIRGIEKALWKGEELRFLPGNRGFAFNRNQGGIYAPAPVTGSPPGKGGTGEKQERCGFDLALTIQGGKTLEMVPLGKNSFFDLETDWTSPSFQGVYLPVRQNIHEKGFDAHWEISHLSRNIPLLWTDRKDEGPDFSSTLFGVNFFKPLDHYDLNTRAVKYGILFVIIPFLGLFLFEIITRREIHPAQYLLAGTGNVIFYLLLLSISEHLPFPAAYGISALSVTVMMGLYSVSLLGARNRGLLMGFILGVLFTFLYFTLQSEDWALLIGSAGAFAITAVVMFLTRKTDWYGIITLPAAKPEPVPDDDPEFPPL
ncbi:MAG: cell envelope integrity protein CreD [Treponema sp.]|jgi:inner membrane protein|nr:cell envelope integrity protein CreD [Treponema sp.]